MIILLLRISLVMDRLQHAPHQPHLHRAAHLLVWDPHGLGGHRAGWVVDGGGALHSHRLFSYITRYSAGRRCENGPLPFLNELNFVHL